MSIKSRSNTKEFDQNYDQIFKKQEVTRVEDTWEVFNASGKRTARFYSLKEALDYKWDYPRDCSGGIKLPNGEWYGS